MTTTTHVSSLDRSVHLTNEWLREVCERAGLGDRQEGYKLLRATLHAVRDRLPVAEAVQLGAQLPALVRGFYYDGWTPSGTPTGERRREEFLARVRAGLDRDGALQEQLEQHVRAVLGLLDEKVSAGEIDDVTGAMPKDVRELWEEARR